MVGSAHVPRGLRPLTYRNYTLFWIGHATSNTGRWIELTGTVWLAYELTGSPILTGLLGLVRAVPALVSSPIAGVVADRIDQRKLLFTTQGLSMIAATILWLLVLSGRVEMWQIYLQVAFQSGVAAFDGAARQALFPRLVPPALLPEAVTLSSTAGRTSQLIGPLIGGAAIATFGVASPFFLNAVTFLALMGAVVAMRGVPPAPRGLRTTFRGELDEGLRYILGVPVLRDLVRLEVVYGLFQMNPVMITIVGREILQVGPEALGGLLAAPAIGSLGGVAFLVATRIKRQGRFGLLCSLIYAGALVLIAGSSIYGVTFAMLVLTGFLDALITVSRLSIAQLIAPPQMRGRVMANMATVSRGTGTLSQTQSGLAAGLLGPAPAIVLAAVAMGVAAVGTIRASPALWSFTTTRDDVSSDGDAGTTGRSVTSSVPR